MAARPVQISLDADLLKRIDRDPEARRAGRSAFVRHAVLIYLESKRRRDVDDQIRTAFAGCDQEVPPEVDDLMAVQAWPKR